MFALGWKELLCVAVYAALVWGGHAIFRLAYPAPKPPAFPPRPTTLRRDLLRATVAFAVACAVPVCIGAGISIVNLPDCGVGLLAE